MKHQLLNLANDVLKTTGMQLSKLASQKTPTNSFMSDPQLQARLVTELADAARPVLEDIFGQAPAPADLEQRIAELFAVLRKRELGRDNFGGSGFHNTFWIFLVCRLIDPKLVIESGVWKGHTSWLLDTINPHAAVHGFDIDISRLEYRGNVDFHQHDWSTYRFDDLDPERALIFFDCHINHAQRILEAKEKGFKHILFDDNPPIHKLYGYILPGFPTAAMLADPSCPDHGDVTWECAGRKVTYTIDKDQFLAARDLIDYHLILPDVGHIVNFGGYSFLSYVRLK